MRFKNAVSVLIISVICTSCVNKFDKILQQEAAQYTANNCPQEAEPGTQLDSLVYNPQERIYTMYYSVSGANEVIIKRLKIMGLHLLTCIAQNKLVLRFIKQRYVATSMLVFISYGRGLRL